MSTQDENGGCPPALAELRSPDGTARLTRAQWMVLAASFLGWMFDGVEIGLFPLIVRPALQSFGITNDGVIANWNSVLVACFLLGAALGGIVFGWLGDKIGRVRSMAMSVALYSLFTGACYFAKAPLTLALFRFIASLGMGGEWALAVALVMECWPEKHRPKLAGAIGAAANFGFLFISIVALSKPVTRDSWRWMMLVGAAPALLTLLIVLFVPESERWKQSVKKAIASGSRPGHWATGLAAAVFAAVMAVYGLVVWFTFPAPGEAYFPPLGTEGLSLWLFRLAQAGLLVVVFRCGSILARRPGWFAVALTLGLAVGIAVWRATDVYALTLLASSFALGAIGAAASVREIFAPKLRKTTLVAAVLSGVPLIGTWAAVSGWVPVWVDQTAQIEAGKRYLDQDRLAQFDDARDPKTKIEILHEALDADQWREVHAVTARDKSWVQFVLSIGAIIGCFLAPILGGAFPRRVVYFLLCLISLLSCGYLFRYLETFDMWFLVVAGFVGAITAAFYGFLPLYLPELFPTRVRATGQGLSFNIGRVIAAFGAVYVGQLVALFHNDYGRAMGAITLVYVIGMVAVWFSPETRGKPLPD